MIVDRAEGVVGVGLTRLDGGYALKVNLEQDRRDQVPEQFEGVPVVVAVCGLIGKR